MSLVQANHTSNYESADDVVKPGDEKLIDCGECLAELTAYLLKHDLV